MVYGTLYCSGPAAADGAAPTCGDETWLMVSGPFVPDTDLRPVSTTGGKTPVMLVRLKRGEKLVTVPPVAADMTLMKYAFAVSAPNPGVMVTEIELPSLKSPCCSSVDSWICVLSAIVAQGNCVVVRIQSPRYHPRTKTFGM